LLRAKLNSYSNLDYLNSRNTQLKGDAMIKRELEKLFLTTHFILTIVAGNTINISPKTYNVAGTTTDPNGTGDIGNLPAGFDDLIRGK
jgi:hypothetical protein